MVSITIAADAEDNGLAAMLHGLVGENLAASPAKRRDFAAIRTNIAVVAPDAEVAVTLCFEGGGCVLRNGARADAELTITAAAEQIPQLSLLDVRYGLPWLFDEAGKRFVESLLRREVRIVGLVDLPVPRPRDTLRRAIDLVRLTRVLSVNG